MLNPAWIQCFLFDCRSPHGERGLKSRPYQRIRLLLWSLPAWGAWIEIANASDDLKKQMSLPAWGAWIEIGIHERIKNKRVVAPRMGSVD